MATPYERDDAIKHMLAAGRKLDAVRAAYEGQGQALEAYLRGDPERRRGGQGMNEYVLRMERSLRTLRNRLRHELRGLEDECLALYLVDCALISSRVATMGCRLTNFSYRPICRNAIGAATARGRASDPKLLPS